VTPRASPWVHLRAEVRNALVAGRPVVALESAVFSHGLPAAEVHSLAARLEAAVREGGAIPACVAVRAGRVEAGVRADDLEFLFAAGAVKVAERDLAVVMGQRRSGGTTVAGTLAVAHAAGIRVMSTGGIGGVHIRAEETGDVSADLLALSRYPLAVVCAGPKAICDPRKTMEALDTCGVTVVGYQTDTLPAFLARSTGVPVPHHVDCVVDLAAIVRAKRRTGGPSAVLVVQAPPPEYALDEGDLDHAVTAASERARAVGVRGADLTPFLLAALSEITGGRSVVANLAVLEANARLAAVLAASLSLEEPHDLTRRRMNIRRERRPGRGRSSA
jgi:pseudouridine-5'-phosphate glycosidase